MTKYPVPDTELLADKRPRRGLHIDIRKNEVVLILFALTAPILGVIVSSL